MTREETVKNLLTELIDMIDNGSQRDLDRADEISKTIIEALSQEPCGDTVSIRKDVLKCRVGNLVAYNVEWLKKHWQMEMDIVCGVKPCDDAISRQSVINVIENDCMRGGLGSCFASYDDAQKFRGEIEQLPSVTQKSVIDDIRIELINEAKEHMREGDYNDGVRFGLMLAEQIVLRHRGTKMVEPQESEE